MYQLWYDNVKPKFGGKAKLCYMDTDSVIVYIKTEGVHIDTETRFNTSNYELDRPCKEKISLKLKIKKD